MIFNKATAMPSPDAALPGRDELMVLNSTQHFVNHHSIIPPWPEAYQQALFGLGCFWGAERLFWQSKGVWVTAVGYSGGYTPNASYAEICSGDTGHNEVVRVIYDPALINYAQLLQTFWQGHDPTQYMRQGNDVGTQYRSGIYTYNDSQQQQAEKSKASYQAELSAAGRGDIQTEISAATVFYYAESAHQQYLAKTPGGYCGLGGTGIGAPLLVSEST